MRGQNRVLWRFVTVLGLALLVTIVLLAVIWTKVSGDEHTTCSIQQRGLPASRELASVMIASSDLFTAPATKAQRRHQVPPSPQQAEALGRLKVHLKRYAALEKQQPLTRQC